MFIGFWGSVIFGFSYYVIKGNSDVKWNIGFVKIKNVKYFCFMFNIIFCVVCWSLKNCIKKCIVLFRCE